MLTMDGVVSRRSSLDLKFQSNNLNELETVADVFRTAVPDSRLALPEQHCFKERCAVRPAHLI